MMTRSEALAQIEAILDAILQGRPHPMPDESCFPDELRPLAASLSKLHGDIQACLSFAQELAEGRLDTAPPLRYSYLSSPVKELQSQLISLCWSMEQLARGNMVSKLYIPGRLFDSYNSLVEKVSQILAGPPEAGAPQWAGPVTSWRYHQILSAINQLRIIVLEVTADGRLIFANPPAREAFSAMDRLPYGDPDVWEEDTLLGYLCTFAQYRDNLEEQNGLHGEFFPVLHELYEPDSGHWYKVTTDVVRLAGGAMGLLHMIDDISEWKRYEYQLKLSANTDLLTSAYTRRAGVQKLEELFGRRFALSNCVAFVDVDGLKAINDQYGHTEGDFTIRAIADALMGCVRKADWVVRYGGDEFLVLFIDCDTPTAQAILARMYQQLEAVNRLSGKPYHMSFSAGLSPITEEMDEVSDLIRVIEREMYQNKLERKSQSPDKGPQGR